MIRKILIDFDDTLHDTESVFASKLDGLLGLEGRELYRIYQFDIHRKIVHEQYPERHDDQDFHWRLLLQRLGEPCDSEKIDLLNSRFAEAFKAVLDGPKLFSDAIPFLERLIEMGYELCLSSGRNSYEKAQALRRAGGKQYFKYILGEEILELPKYKPAYYRKALRMMGSRAHETLSIGDSILNDIVPAKAVGMRTVWVNRRREEPPIDLKMIPDCEVEDLISALNYISHT